MLEVHNFTQKGDKKNDKLPEFFRSVLWSYDFSSINPQKSQKTIIVNSVNYGDWRHLEWIFRYYGKNQLKKIIENVAVSEFRERALKLICLFLGIKKLKYASRSAKIRTKRDI